MVAERTTTPRCTGHHPHAGRDAGGARGGLHEPAYGRVRSSPIAPACSPGGRPVRRGVHAVVRPYETVGIGTLLRPDDHRSGDPTRLKSAGRRRLTSNSDRRARSGTTLTAGEVGEIVLRADSDARLLRQPEETKRLFLTAVAPHGRRRLPGPRRVRLHRRSHQGHHRLWWREHRASGDQNVLAAHPPSRSRGRGVPSSEWGETPRAFVARRTEATSRGGAARLLSRALAHFNAERNPLDRRASTEPVGKVLRRELRDHSGGKHRSVDEQDRGRRSGRRRRKEHR